MTSDLSEPSPEAARAAAEQLHHANDRLKAIRVIAATAKDGHEAKQLFAMLGLGTDEVRTAAHSRTVAA